MEQLRHTNRESSWGIQLIICAVCCYLDMSPMLPRNQVPTTSISTTVYICTVQAWLILILQETIGKVNFELANGCALNTEEELVRALKNWSQW